MVSSDASNRRIFNKQPYFSDLVSYSSKDEAKTLISQIKSLDKTVKARIVEKADGIFIYFDAHSFEDFTKGKYQDILRKRKKSKPERTKSHPNLKSQTVQVKKTDQIKSELSILERQERLPGFLMNRLSKKAITILQKSVLEAQKTSKKDLEQELDVIRSEQVKFDIRYEHEKEMLDYINRVAKIIEQRIREYADQESEIFLKTNVLVPLKRGDFQKQLSKLEKMGVDEVAYLIFRKLGRKAKKYPYKENHLIGQIRNLLTSTKLELG